LLLLALLAACSPDPGRIEGVLADYCRSRAEGHFPAFRVATGGDILLQTLRDRSFRKRFEDAGAENAKNGTLFIEVYVTSIDIDRIRHQAEAVYLEKFGKGLKTWAIHHQSALEYIDGAWRVIDDRQLTTR